MSFSHRSIILALRFFSMCACTASACSVSFCSRFTSSIATTSFALQISS